MSDYLNSMGDSAGEELDVGEDSMTIMPLGGGQEVGRSCILLKYRGRTVMLDCGNHPGREGMDAQPFFDEVDADKVDLILITHFHIDHCAALPYFTERTNFKGRVFMTHATKAVMQLMISDFVKLGGGNKSSTGLYNDKDFRSCMDKIEVIDYHTTVTYKGIQFCGYVAGHVLGAAMFAISIDGVKVLYTGDYSMEEDRHLMPAEVPPDRPDVLIVESTYGVTNHSSREERESRFTSTVEAIVRRKGNCLIPVFALGRAQELLLILDEYWKHTPDLHNVPIYYASKMASKALRVYQTFVNMMNAHIQTLMDIKNPFHFNHISNLKGADSSMQLMAPCVVMAAPGMLQNGESRRLFEDWCDNEKNGVVLAGYSVEGTLAKRLLSDPDEITCMNGRIKKCLCSIEYVSFSAHVDYLQNSQFIRSVVPDNIVLVHGEKNEMARLKAALDRDIEQSWPDSTHTPTVVMPDNCVPVKLTFDKPIVADVVGSVATRVLHEMASHNSSGALSLDHHIDIPEKVVMITENFQSKIMKTSDINAYSSCRIGRIDQQMLVPIPQDMLQLRQHNHINIIHLLIPHLKEVFDTVTEEVGKGCDVVNANSSSTICIQNSVKMEENVTGDHKDCITVTWTASPTNDLIADCATGLLFQVLSTTHFLRACWLEAHKVKGGHAGVVGAGTGGGGVKRPNGDDPIDDTTSTSTAVPATSADEVVIKRMKMGLIDPSRAFVLDNQVDGLIYEDVDPKVIAKTKPKLENIRLFLMLFKDNLFQSVTFSRNGLRLIIRAEDRSVSGGGGDGDDDENDADGDDNEEEEEDVVIAEAYLYIHWGDKVAETCSGHHHSHSHSPNKNKNKSATKICTGHAHHSTATSCHAVVQSTSVWLREQVSSALRQIEHNNTF